MDDTISSRFEISTHAPLTGCDGWVGTVVTALTGISTHAPLTGCDMFGGWTLCSVV